MAENRHSKKQNDLDEEKQKKKDLIEKNHKDDKELLNMRKSI